MNRIPTSAHAPVAQARIDTPLGALTAVATDQGLAGLWFDGQAHHPGPSTVPAQPDQRWLAQARAELDAYFAGRSARFTVPLDPAGTPFQRAVWQALRSIPAGATRSYGEIAAMTGHAGAARAAGAAIGRNPLSIVVPCHRVVGRDGALTGYAGGIERKRALLAHESRWRA